MRLPRTTGLAIGLIGLLAAPLPAHAQADPLAVFACERAYGETRHGDAAALCRPLAEAGSADAQAIMGTLHQNGQAVARDYAEAARWFDLSARQGHVEAQFNLAALYNYGAGVARDLVEAYAWYDLAADAGNGDAAAGRALVEKRGPSPPQLARPENRPQPPLYRRPWARREVISRPWSMSCAASPNRPKESAAVIFACSSA